MIDTGRFQHLSSGGLALLVHGLFFTALVFGVSWKNPPQLPVEADLWTALPEPPPPVVEPEPLPEASPPPRPVSENKPDEADIALEKAEKKKQEAALRLEAQRLEKQRKEESRQEELRRQAEEKLRQEQVRRERETMERERQDKNRRDQARRQMEQELARQMQDDLESEATQLRAIQDRAKASRDARVISDFKHRIQSKIQSYVRLPQKLSGNPEAVFQVNLLPNGEISRVTLVKSSGQPTYDSEVERAILKASPLPLPGERDAAAVFRDGLNLKFRPFENGASARDLP